MSCDVFWTAIYFVVSYGFWIEIFLLVSVTEFYPFSFPDPGTVVTCGKALAAVILFFWSDSLSATLTLRTVRTVGFVEEPARILIVSENGCE